ncbi:hypothetical protein J4Q44_G00109830, partial [Coregonus suidteri]
VAAKYFYADLRTSGELTWLFSSIGFCVRNKQLNKMELEAMTRYTSPVNPAVFPHLTVVLLAIGMFFTAWFFVYPSVVVYLHSDRFCVDCESVVFRPGEWRH